MASGCLEFRLIPSEGESQACCNEVSFGASGTGPFEYCSQHRVSPYDHLGDLSRFGDGDKRASLPYSNAKTRRGSVGQLGCTDVYLMACKCLKALPACPYSDSDLHISTAAGYCSSPSDRRFKGCSKNLCVFRRYLRGFWLAF